MGLKTDVQTPSKVDSITKHKNVFSVDEFQMLIITERQVKSTL